MSIRNTHPFLRRALTLALALAAVPAGADEPSERGLIVVGNRTSGTLSVIDVATDTVIKTVPVAIPGARPPEPMYVNYVPALKRVFVSDRSNRYVAAYDSRSFELLNTAPLGKGAFHMWADPKGRTLWSVNDIDRTLSVINPKNLKPVATVDLPQEVRDAGGIPHDIAISPDGKAAFVTVLLSHKEADVNDRDGDGNRTELTVTVADPGLVLRYDTRTRKVTHRFTAGIDPHVGLGWKKPVVYVASQGSNTVHALSTRDLKELHPPINVSGAHGTGMKHNDKTFYTTNLPGLGKDGLVAIDVASNTVVGKTDTGNAAEGIEDVPHNIAICARDTKLYLTHSGHGEGEAKGVVTVYDVRDDSRPKFLKKIKVGLNPFGIAYVR